MTSVTRSEPEGPRFGPYILTAVLGRGGMGVVYRAYDTVKARTVALKVLTPELAADPVYRERFRRESRRAARLSEPHIIPIHDYGQIEGRLFIDMRLVQGTDLSTMLERDGPLPPNGAAWVIAQVASALDAAHAEGLVHRDIKPSNVLITGHIQSMPFAYLIDFGIARSVGSVTVSTAASAVGTLAYMAPERIEGSPGDHRSDVYSLACVLYECLIGHEPFTGEMVAVMWAQINTPPPAPTAARPGLPAAVDQVIARGMAKDPAGRYDSAGELAAAMLAAVDPSVAQAQAEAPEPAPPTAVTYIPPKGDRPAPHQTGADLPLWESDPGGRAQAALRAIVAHPQLGAAALSSSQAMSAALKDLLPGRPRETKVLVAAAEVGLTAALKYHTARGMDVTTARRRAARSFAKHTGFTPEACSWAVDHLTAALGLDTGSGVAR
jgi:serine/threonine protein kinase